MLRLREGLGELHGIRFLFFVSKLLRLRLLGSRVGRLMGVGMGRGWRLQTRRQGIVGCKNGAM